mmetsp:Transcript_28690/g.46194  ORF Transcript_28690/g.46194 Transcript_28690/m.46194 type:complete len:237 (+) Transcript_28690:54-764(+)|eukprot:CAMPEP_0169366454 /NCGR_PEP_ID=MMETSP1017-20121227/33126_1 /TAXON_ID=342587 /ORGANISM="Karlodinium micrum, Strain CCMP2283" /LENGTH=236 /DNA_ID=CAMNT_0009464393 /DNA_START=65 /DNA_END=775 /DNA_ORIENTATION=-
MASPDAGFGASKFSSEPPPGFSNGPPAGFSNAPPSQGFSNGPPPGQGFNNGPPPNQGFNNGQPPGTQENRFRGSVKFFDIERGSGLIESEPARAMYGGDVFFVIGAFPPGRNPAVGEEIEFGVTIGHNGPQACNVSYAIQPTVPDPASGRFLGVVRAFDMTKGWGHIDCREARGIFGKDIFLLRSALRGAEVAPGNQLEFAVNVGPKGPVARDVCLVDYGPTINDAIHYRRMPNIF